MFQQALLSLVAKSDLYFATISVKSVPCVLIYKCERWFLHIYVWKQSVDRGESIWDYMTHANPGLIQDGSNMDVASDFYHKYKEDLRLARSIGVSIKILFAFARYEYLLISFQLLLNIQLLFIRTESIRFVYVSWIINRTDQAVEIRCNDFYCWFDKRRHTRSIISCRSIVKLGSVNCDVY